MSRPGLTHERLMALFVLGVVLFTPPFLGIFNTPDRILGLPSLYLYLFAAWTLLIVLVALAIEGSDADDGPARTTEAPAGGSEVTSDRTGA
jgi:hypothetical protein